MSRALIVHATDLLRRGVLAASPDIRAPSGAPANALYASIKALRRALSHPPSHAIAVLHEAPGADWDPLAVEQFEALEHVLEAHGIPVERCGDPTRRAAAWVRRAGVEDRDATVLGYDKRLAQLVSDRVRFHDAYKDVRYTPELVHKRFGVGPPHIAAWAALVGDRYAMKGIKGIGQKGAVVLLETHGSMDAVLEALPELEGRVGKALRAAGNTVRSELAAATLDPDPPPSPLPLWNAPSSDALNRTYRDLGFLQLLTAAPSKSEVDVLATPEAVAKITEWKGPLSLFSLTTRPSPVRGQLVGVAFASATQSAFVPTAGLPALASWLADSSIPKTGHDTKATTVALRNLGLDLCGIVGDTALASHLLQPSALAPHELGPLCKAYLGLPLPEPDAVLGRGAKRRDWDAQPLGVAAAFAVKRAEAAHALWKTLAGRDFDAMLLSEGLRLSEILVEMERRGVPVDAAALDEAGEDFTVARDELEARITELAGHSFSINSTKQLGTVLFEELELPVMSRTKTGWSTANHALERIAHLHPIVPLVMKWRQLRRLQDSWVTALHAAIDPDGRVRSTFHPARSFTGRLVNSHPDLGRTPGRTSSMARIRRCFRARDGWVLLSIDYVQLGLFVLAHLTEDPHLVGPLSRDEDMHTATARAVLDIEEVDEDQRQTGKMVNFASFAGQGPSALAVQLGVDIAQAKQLMAKFHERYAQVARFQDQQLELAKTTGIRTLSGRPWPIPDLSSRDAQIRGYAERLARRATHEASVADVTRRGLVHAADALCAAGLAAVPLLQIHDEILFEVPRQELEATMRIAGEAMRGVYSLVVPLRVGFKTGANWADLQAAFLPERQLEDH